MRAAGRGGEGHIGFDKWTVKVPIWPSLWLFLPALLSTLVLYYPSFIPLLCSPAHQCKSTQARSERLTECKPTSALQRRKEDRRQGEVFMTQSRVCKWLAQSRPPFPQCGPVEKRQPLTFGIGNSWTVQRCVNAGVWERNLCWLIGFSGNR